MEPLSRKQQKLIQSLKQKKYRDQLDLFLFEGKKLLDEAIGSQVEISTLVVEDSYELEFDNGLSIRTVDSVAMKKLSNLKQAPGILGVAKQLKFEPITPKRQDVMLMLDQISDPGNLGTIIRNAVAFGVTHIICSENTVDCYNSKTVQASMGALFKTNMLYTDLSEWIKKYSTDVAVYPADLSGESIYGSDWTYPAVILLGSESHGIEPALLKLSNRAIKIPIHSNIESLNVSSASAVLLAEFRRRLNNG